MPQLAILLDPQTSGGLLFGVAADAAEATVAELHASGDVGAAVIGNISAGDDAPITFFGGTARK